MSERKIRIATRRSQLALWQANYTAARLRELDDAPEVELVPVVTEGDQNQKDALRQFGGTGVFTREVQDAVLDGRADLAVHSLKDLPTVSADGLTLACVPERANRCDCLILPADSEGIADLSELAEGIRVGTGSPRRQAQLLSHRPDLEVAEIRGNVDTRLRKLDKGEYGAILLAEAGLRRLGLEERITVVLGPPVLYPAVSQGALGIECREDDSETQEYLARLSCPLATSEVTAERSLLRTLRAGCHAPLGAWCEVRDTVLSLTGVLLSLDGRTRLEQSASGPVEEAEQIGMQVAELLLEAGAEELLKASPGSEGGV